MARLFVPLDVNYTSDDKILAAGAMAELLYVRSLALAKRLLSDGLIRDSQLASLALGIPGKASVHASALVREGLWTEVDGGWRITEWGKWNKSREAITDELESRRQAGIRGNHERWHTDGRTSHNCPLCIANGSQVGSHVR